MRPPRCAPRKRFVQNAAAMMLASIGCISLGLAQENAPATEPAAGANEGNLTTEVDIGGGRHLYLICRGTGSPTVILESGYHDSSDPWSIADGHPPAVMDRLAAFTRVCAYDRPGTIRYVEPPEITKRSTSVPMPRTAGDVVSDLHALLAAAEVPGPYVLVGHSLGGLFVRLYAQTYPDQVIGMVFVDAFAAELPELLGTQWAGYAAILDRPVPEFADDRRSELIDINASAALVKKAPALRRMPLAVIVKGEPFLVPPGAKLTAGFAFEELERVWPMGAKALVKLEPETPEIIATGSDHYLQVQQPDLVADTVKLVIGRAKQAK